ncbi:hypothetical protein GCM10027180_14110 [Microbulbifer echini]
MGNVQWALFVVTHRPAINPIQWTRYIAQGIFSLTKSTKLSQKIAQTCQSRGE